MAKCLATKGCKYIAHEPSTGRCEWEKSKGITCPEGWVMNAKWNSYAAPSHTLLVKGKYCKSSNTNILTTTSMQACADKCRATKGCRFIAFSKTGKYCMWEKTKTAACPEGWGVHSSWDSYEVHPGLPPAATTKKPATVVKGGYYLVKKGAFCSSSNTKIATTKDVATCMAKCRSTKGCMYIAHEASSGRCEWEKSKGVHCPEGWRTSSSWSSYATPSHTLLQKGKYCKSPGTNIVSTSDMQVCANKCRATKGCRFIAFAPKSKLCYWEKTATAACPEGWGVSSAWDSYEVHLTTAPPATGGKSALDSAGCWPVGSRVKIKPGSRYAGQAKGHCGTVTAKTCKKGYKQIKFDNGYSNYYEAPDFVAC